MVERREFKAWLEGDHICVKCWFQFSTVLKMIKGAEWNGVRRVWYLPLTADSLEGLRGVKGAQIDGAITEAVGVDFELSADPIPEDLEGVIKKMPVKAKPYAHQAAAFKRAMEVLG